MVWYTGADPVESAIEPITGLTATTVQGAIAELKAEIDAGGAVLGYNSTGATITKGQPVYLTRAASNGIPVVALAQANYTKMPVYGLASENIANNTSGLFIRDGILTGVDTTGMTVTYRIFPSGVTAGALISGTSTSLYSQNLGFVLTSDINGSILVKVEGFDGSILGTYQNVFIVGDGVDGSTRIRFDTMQGLLDVIANPTANRVLNWPDKDGTLATTSDVPADFTLLERYLADLPITSITRNVTTGLIETVVRSGTVSGVSRTITETITRNGSTGLISSVAVEYVGTGDTTKTKTTTFTRNGSNQITGSSVVVT